jgi:cytochrome b
MLLMLSVQIGLGLFAVDEDGLDPSPLAKFVSFETGRAIAKLHHAGFNVLLGLIALHLVAIAAYAARGRNLVPAMITGRMRLGANASPPRIASPRIAVLAAVIAALLAWFVSQGLKI